MCGFTQLKDSNAGVPVLQEFWFPYASLIALASGGLGNVFSANAYKWDGGGPGAWSFNAGPQNTFVSQATWQDTDGQDSGSTFGS